MPNAGGDTSYIGATTDNSVEDNCLASEADNVTKADEETATQTAGVVAERLLCILG